MQRFLTSIVGLLSCCIFTASCAAFCPAVSHPKTQPLASPIRSTGPRSPRPTISKLSNRSVSSSSLPMIPSPTVTTVALTVGHVIGGSAAVPLVFQATTTWYRKITLPAWTPPDRVFGPVWTVLYAGMGLAVARVLQRLPTGVVMWKTPAVGLWILHYALNLCWAPAFFGAQRLRLGLWTHRYW